MINRAAFSLFELLMVLGLLALLASVSVPAVRSWQNRIDIDRARNEIVEMINEAKRRAVREGCSWHVHLDQTHASLRLEQAAKPATIVRSKLPVDDIRALPSSVQIEFIRMGSGEKLTSISVNALGSPTPAQIWLSRNGQRIQGYQVDRLTGGVNRLK